MELTQFLKNVASAQLHDVFHDISGEISLRPEQSITQTSGAVYGLAVELTNQELLAFREELPKRKRNFPFQPIEGSWYALYWGKDLTPGARIKAHVQGHKNNGNAHLKKYKALNNKNIKYAALFVSNYEDFEGYLHANYQPILGTKKKGSSTKIVRVLL